jgi:hypothetical protein
MVRPKAKLIGDVERFSVLPPVAWHPTAPLAAMLLLGEEIAARSCFLLEEISSCGGGWIIAALYNFQALPHPRHPSHPGGQGHSTGF